MIAMNRTVAFAFALTSIILVSQNSFSIASYTSNKRIASSGIIITEPAHARIRKFIVLYGGGRLTDEQASYVASNFDIVDTNLGVYGFDKVKNLNPNITILMYRDIMAMHTGYEDWEEVDSHEDWFLHDIHGNRLVNKYYGWYGMDVGSTGWRNHFANFVKAKLDAYPVFDGIFADDVWVWYDYHNDDWTVDSSLVPPEIPQRWYDDMVGMIQHVKSVLGSKLLILNDQSIGDYSKYADGIMSEGFVHGSWMSDTTFGSISYWKRQVDSLQSLSGSGKYYMALSAVSTSTDEATAQKILKYCLCSYLLGVNGERASFGFNNHYGFSYLETWLHSIYEDVELLGEPSGLYYPLDFVYARDFDNGKVLVNPDIASHTVNLEGNYETLDGRTVSSVTLQPNTGMILIELS